jgi:hypothetical protein
MDIHDAGNWVSRSGVSRKSEFPDLSDRFFASCVKTTGLVLDLVFIELDTERA